MKPVFADTSYYVALLVAQDVHHDKAVELSQSVLGRTYLSEHVLMELGNYLAKSEGRRAYAPFVRGLLADKGVKLVPGSTELFHEGLDLFESRPDKNWSLVDCTSFVVTKQHRLREALTADHHFEQAGFKALLI